MASTPAVLWEPVDMPGGSTIYYTVPPEISGAYIDKANALNHSASPVQVSIWAVPSGGSVSDANQVVKGKSILAGGNYQFPELIGRYIAPGTSIYAQASSASAVTWAGSGRVITNG